MTCGGPAGLRPGGWLRLAQRPCCTSAFGVPCVPSEPLDDHSSSSCPLGAPLRVSLGRRKAQSSNSQLDFVARIVQKLCEAKTTGLQGPALHPAVLQCC